MKLKYIFRRSTLGRVHNLYVRMAGALAGVSVTLFVLMWSGAQAFAADAYLPVGVSIPPPSYAAPGYPPGQPQLGANAAADPSFEQDVPLQDMNLDDSAALVEDTQGFYVRGDAAFSFLPFGFEVLTPGITSGSAQVKIKDLYVPDLGGVTFGGGAGYDLGTFRVDATYTFAAGKFETGNSIAGTTIAGPLKGTVKHHIGMLNAYADFPINEVFEPYIGAGAGISYAQLSNMTNATDTFKGKDVIGFSGAAHLGSGIRMTELFSFDVGYDLMAVSEVLADVTGATGANSSTIPLSTAHGLAFGFFHQVHAGLRIYF